MPAARFNSRSRVGSDCRALLIVHLLSTFQFTLPRGERQLAIPEGVTKIGVSIHAPAWGATHRPRPTQGVQMFQFTLPRGERPLPFQVAGVELAFQFTLPRGERPHGLQRLQGGRGVSIHAPAWGATAPSSPLTPPSSSFNSRSRVGSDPVKLTPPAHDPVSIHAPAWGATRKPKDVTFPRRCFNSRSRVGSDPRRPGQTDRAAGFNSRSRVGSDVRGRGQLDGRRGFNSRSRVGSDLRPSTPPLPTPRFNSRSRVGSDTPSTT